MTTLRHNSELLFPTENVTLRPSSILVRERAGQHTLATVTLEQGELSERMTSPGEPVVLRWGTQVSPRVLVGYVDTDNWGEKAHLPGEPQRSSTTLRLIGATRPLQEDTRRVLHHYTADGAFAAIASDYGLLGFADDNLHVYETLASTGSDWELLSSIAERAGLVLSNDGVTVTASDPGLRIARLGSVTHTVTPDSTSSSHVTVRDLRSGARQPVSMFVDPVTGNTGAASGVTDHAPFSRRRTAPVHGTVDAYRETVRQSLSDRWAYEVNFSIVGTGVLRVGNPISFSGWRSPRVNGLWTVLSLDHEQHYGSGSSQHVITGMGKRISREGASPPRGTPRVPTGVSLAPVPVLRQGRWAAV